MRRRYSYGLCSTSQSLHRLETTGQHAKQTMSGKMQFISVSAFSFPATNMLMIFGRILRKQSIRASFPSKTKTSSRKRISVTCATTVPERRNFCWQTSSKTTPSANAREQHRQRHMYSKSYIQKRSLQNAKKGNVGKTSLLFG